MWFPIVLIVWFSINASMILSKAYYDKNGDPSDVPAAWFGAFVDVAIIAGITHYFL
jgi:hypothetical protein